MSAELVYSDIENREKPLSEAEAKIRKRQIEGNPLYSYHCVLQKNSEEYKGEITIRFKYNKVDSVDGTFVDFFGKKITRLEANGHNLLAAADTSSLWTASRLHFKDDVLKNGQENEVVIHFVNDYDHTGAGLHSFVDPEDSQHYVYTNFEPYDCRRWMPNFDQPNIKGKLSLSVTGPADWHIVANSIAESDSGAKADGTKSLTFRPTPPISSYIYALVGGPFEKFVDTYANDRVPLGMYCRKSLAKFIDTPELFEVTKQGLAFYEDFFGMKFPFSKYDQVFCPEFNHGAMENVGCVTFTEHYIFRDKPTEARRVARADTFLHEMAHMWFGNLVTMDWWNGLWLNESFATYMAALAVAESTRFGDMSWLEFNAGMKSWAYREDQLPTTHPVEGEIIDTDATFLNFDGITYGKGASLLKQLVHLVGMKGFKEGMRHYFEKHAWGNTTIHDFLAALAYGAQKESSSNSFDPKVWAKMWLEEAGLNSIAPRVTSADGKITKFEIIQTHPAEHPTLRSHRIQIALFNDDGSVRKTVDVTVLPQETTEVVELKGEPVAPFFYVNYGDHGYVKVLLDAASEKFASEHMEKFSSLPLLRQLLWQDIYNMARDAKMKSTIYLQMARDKLLSENDPKLVQSVLRRVQACLHNFVPDSLFNQESAELYKFAWNGFNQAVRNNRAEDQLIWANAIISFASNREHVEEMTKYLSEDHAVLGGDFKLEQGMRWSIVEKACGHGLTNAPALLDAEQQRDKSDRGQRAVLTAKSSFPDVNVKREAWARYTAKEQKQSSHNSAADMSGFRWRHQRVLLSEFTDKFFDVVRSIYKDHPRQYAESFFSLFPAEPEDDHVLKRSAQLLAELQAEDQILVKSLKQEIDDLRRARACRSLFKN